MDEETPTCTGLTQEMVLAQHNCAGYRGWYEAQQRCAPPEKSVINMI
jgi:hypothetical protein